MSYILATGLYNEEVIDLTIANTNISNNLNSLSTQSTLNISNLNATSTSLFTDLNSLSTNSTLSISNLNATSTTLFTDLNSLSTNSTLNINNLQGLFEYGPANSPTFTNGTQATINDTDYYIQFLTNGTITIPTNMMCDCLIVGAGGRGGLNAYAGGGGAGEVIYYPSFNFVSGVYYVNVGVDSATTTNRDSILHREGIKYLNATGGGDGGNGADLTLSPFVPKSWTSSTAEVANRTINGITCTGRDITLNSTSIYYGVGTYELYYSSTRYAMDNVGNPYALFNFDYTPGTAGFGGTFRANNYSAATGLTTTLGNTYYMPDINYKGDWYCVKFPTAEIIYQFKIYRRSDLPPRSPKAYRIYASNDSTTWTQLLDITNATYNASHIHISSVTNSTAYLYYCFCVNSLQGGINGEYMNINEIVFLNYKYIKSSTSSVIGGSGGGGGGGCLINNQLGAIAGNPFHITYSKLTAGNDATTTNGGNGGSALITGRYTATITNNNFNVGGGGNGADSSSAPIIKSNYGDGGDGNGGLGFQGIVIFKFSVT